jgi:hypothetical protein
VLLHEPVAWTVIAVAGLVVLCVADASGLHDHASEEAK